MNIFRNPYFFLFLAFMALGFSKPSFAQTYPSCTTTVYSGGGCFVNPPLNNCPSGTVVKIKEATGTCGANSRFFEFRCERDCSCESGSTLVGNHCVPSSSSSSSSCQSGYTWTGSFCAPNQSSSSSAGGDSGSSSSPMNCEAGLQFDFNWSGDWSTTPPSCLAGCEINITGVGFCSGGNCSATATNTGAECSGGDGGGDGGGDTGGSSSAGSVSSGGSGGSDGGGDGGGDDGGSNSSGANSSGNSSSASSGTGNGSASSGGSSSGTGGGGGGGTGSSSSSGTGGNGSASSGASSCGSGEKCTGKFEGGACSPDAPLAPKCDGDDAVTCAVAIHTWTTQCQDKLWRDGLVGTDEYRNGDSVLPGQGGSGDSDKNVVAKDQTEFRSLVDDLSRETFLSAGCPAPFVVSAGKFGSLEFSVEPLCNFAGLLRPLIIALGVFLSGLILIRGIQ